MGTRGWNLPVALLAAAAGCGIDVDFSGARFACEVAADCPTGQSCSAGYCGAPEEETAGADAAPGPSPSAADAAETTEQLVFHPVADAYVDSAQPDMNRGASEELRVDGLPAVISYIQFGTQELSNVDERYHIESARLEVFANSAHASGYQLAIVADQGWSETAVTYLDAPLPGELVGSSGPVEAETWTSIDLAAVMAEGDYESFALSTEDATALSLASREDDEHAPRLVLAIDPP